MQELELAFKEYGGRHKRHIEDDVHLAQFLGQVPTLTKIYLRAKYPPADDAELSPLILNLSIDALCSKV